MGRAKRRIKAKRKAEHMRREQIRIAMNKRVFFTLTRCHTKLKGIVYRYCYKSNMHNLIYKGAKFENVRYQSSIITKCNFNQAELVGVDFCNCNLRNTSFRNAKLRNVCFINCNVDRTDFLDADFQNVVFVCTGIERANNLFINSKCRVYRTYPKIELTSDVETQLLQFSEDPLIYNPHVLHVSKNKLNHWTLKILQDIYGDDTFRALCAVKNRKHTKGLYTIHSYMKHIESYLKL